MKPPPPPHVATLLILFTIAKPQLSSSTVNHRTSCDVIFSVAESISNRGCFIANNTDTSRVEYQCNSVEDILISISAVNNSINGGLNCTELQIPPGEHTIQGSYLFTGKSIRIVRSPYEGGADVVVHFNTNPVILQNLRELEPLFVWRFESIEWAEISGLSFVNSTGIISFQNVTHVTVENCTFKAFTEGAVDVYDSPHITITSCTFRDSGYSASVIKDRSYSIHSGGLSISQNNLNAIYSDPFVSVTKCTFYNNSAIPSLNLARSTNQIFSNQIFTGRGGALGIALHSPHSNPIHVTVADCHFESNIVRTWGAGTYFIFGPGSNHSVVFRNNVYLRNRSFNGAGGLFVGTLSGGFPDLYSTCIVIDCDFIGNHADQGAGALWPEAQAEGTTQSIYNLGIYEGCKFINNTASNFAALSLVTGGAAGGFRTPTGSRPVTISNCTFSGNKGGSTPAFGTLYVPISLIGHNIFDRNTGGAIQVIGCRASIQGTVVISNTDLVDTRTGALTLTSLAQVTLFRGARLRFENNTGSLGAAIYAQATKVSQVFADILSNPLCFMLYEDSHVPPNEWSDVEVSFTGNTALVGAAVFTSQLRTCSWTQNTDPYFNVSHAFRWNFIKFGENIDTYHDQDPADPAFFIQTLGENIKIYNKTISVYPGEEFEYDISITDELGNPVFAAVQARDPDEQSTRAEDGHSSFAFIPSVHALNTQSQKYSSIALLHDGEPFNYSNPVAIQSIENTLFAEEDNDSMLSITFSQCPPGYTLQFHVDSDFKTCVCNDRNKNIVTCIGERVLFNKMVWATVDAGAVDMLYTYTCPVGYCACTSEGSLCYNTYHNRRPDDQCVSKRKGILCGECRSNGEGVSALLNNCVTCHDGYSVLIPILVLVNIIVVVLLTRFLLCHKYPSWLLPCAFYIQFLPYGSSSLSNGFSNIQPYLLYVSSTLSFYFPYDFCLYSNMSALVLYSLRFIPFFVIFFTSTTVILYCWNFNKSVVRNDWYLIWILFLLNYQFTLYTSMSILNCPSIPTDEGQRGHWFVNGSIQCFTGSHIPLALLAILMILILAAMIPISLLMSLRIIEHPIWLKRIQRPLHFWYKEQYKWWYSVELARRFLLTLMVVAFSGNVYPVAFVYCASIGLFSYVQPYNSFYANLLEIIFSTTTTILFNLDGHLQFQYQAQSSAVVHLTSYLTNPLLWIGGILYYIPLLVTCSVIAVSIGFKVRNQIVKRKKVNNKRHSADLNSDEKDLYRKRFSTAYELRRPKVSTTLIRTNVGSKNEPQTRH